MYQEGDAMLKEDIVDVISKREIGLTRNELAEQFPEIPKSTLYTALQKLERARIVEQANGFYSVVKTRSVTTQSVIENELINNSLLYDRNAEEAALRFLIQNPEHIGTYLEHINNNTFHTPQYRELFARCYDAYCADGELKVHDILFNSEEQELVGKLKRSVNTVTSLNPLLEGLAQCQKRRDIAIELSEALGKYLESPKHDTLAASVISVVDKMRSASQEKHLSYSFESVDRVLANIVEQQKPDYASRLITTGYKNLDKALGKIRPGQLITIAARPSIGKTSFALDMALRIGEVFKQQNRMLYFKSLEMDEDELIVKCMARYSGLSVNEINMGSVGAEGLRRIKDASQKISDLPIVWDCHPYLKPFILRENLKRLKERHNVSVVMVDYLQLMEADRELDQEYAILRDVTRKLKLLAKELHIPIIILSQLSRDVEKAGGKVNKPKLSDLRGSGTIEQDSDVVIMLHREDFYDDDPPDVSEMEVLLRKVRMGRTGRLNFYFDKVHNRIDEQLFDAESE